MARFWSSSLVADTLLRHPSGFTETLRIRRFCFSSHSASPTVLASPMVVRLQTAVCASGLHAVLAAIKMAGDPSVASDSSPRRPKDDVEDDVTCMVLQASWSQLHVSLFAPMAPRHMAV